MTRIQPRRGTAAAWTAANPTLAPGEVGYETDTGLSKRGNGSTAWNSLSYDFANFTVAALASRVHAAAEKTTEVDTDEFPFIDSEASFALKKYTVATLKKLIRSRGTGLRPGGYISGQYYAVVSANNATTSNALGLGILRVMPWFVPKEVTISKLWSEYTAAGDAATVLRMGVYLDDGTGKPGSLLVDGGTVGIGGTPGSVEVNASATVPAGLNWIGGVPQGTGTQPTIRTIALNGPWPVQLALGSTLPTSASSFATGWLLAGVTGALPSSMAAAGATTTGPRVGIKAA